MVPSTRAYARGGRAKGPSLYTWSPAQGRYIRGPRRRDFTYVVPGTGALYTWSPAQGLYIHGPRHRGIIYTWSPGQGHYIRGPRERELINIVPMTGDLICLVLSTRPDVRGALAQGRYIRGPRRRALTYMVPVAGTSYTWCLGQAPYKCRPP